jgi:membrane protein implicated in regulation of membrane protease activity
MHPLLLLLPLVGLALFFFLSWQAALPLYVIIFVGSLALYWKIIQAQRRRPIIGKRAMTGDRAVVVSAKGEEVEVDYQGEIWRAISSQPLQQGDQVIIMAVEGLILRVAPSQHGNSKIDRS